MVEYGGFCMVKLGKVEFKKRLEEIRQKRDSEELEKVVLSIGLNDKDLHNQKVSDDDAYNKIVETLGLCGIIGATLNGGAIGIYNGEREKSVQITLYKVNMQKVKAFVEKIKIELNQESVAVEVVKNIEVKFM